MLNLLLPATGPRRDFYVSLARVVQSGASPLDGLKTIEMSGSGRTAVIARTARSGLEAGKKLAASLAGAGNLIPEVHLALLDAGEQSGHMVETLELLAQLDEARIGQGRSFRSRLAYPTLVLLLSCFILPLPMLVLGSGSAYGAEVATRIGTLLSVVAGIWVGIRLLIHFGVPLLRALPGSLERRLMPGQSAFFFLVLRTCLRSGIPLTQALDMGARTWTTRGNREAARQASTALQTGSTLMQALLPLVGRRHMLTLSTGEMSGKMEDAFADLEKEFEQKSQSRQKLMTMLVSTAIALVVMAYVASQIFSGFQQGVGSQMEEFEREINHETRGIWDRQ